MGRSERTLAERPDREVAALGVVGIRRSQPAARAPGAAAVWRPVVVDVAMFYAQRSGGIRTYLDEKARVAAMTGSFEHHLIVPGRREQHDRGRHEVRSLRVIAPNGYRIPVGAGALKDTLRRLRPDYVLLHDPFWGPHGVTELAHELGAKVIAVHHATPALGAAAMPGPHRLYAPILRGAYRHAYKSVDAVMSVIDPKPDTGREVTIPLRFGLDPAFRPAPARREDHLLYVGRLSLEKRIGDLFAAASLLEPHRSVLVVGDGPAHRALMSSAERLGLDGRVRFRPFVADRRELARLYREAGCVVDPGPHENLRPGCVRGSGERRPGRRLRLDPVRPSRRWADRDVHPCPRRRPCASDQPGARSPRRPSRRNRARRALNLGKRVRHRTRGARETSGCFARCGHALSGQPGFRG